MYVWRSVLACPVCPLHSTSVVCSRVVLARTIYIYGVCTVFLAEKSPNIRSYTVYIYGSGQPYSCVVCSCLWGSNTALESVGFLYVSRYASYIGLASTVYIHRIWPYIWWFPCWKYRIYTVHIWFWPTLIIHHIHSVYKRYIWQANDQIYGHKRCIYTILANPSYEQAFCNPPLWYPLLSSIL